MVVVLAYDERDEQTSAKVDDNGRVPKASFGKPLPNEAWKRFCDEIGVPDKLPEALGGDRAPSWRGSRQGIASEFGECDQARS